MKTWTFSPDSKLIRFYVWAWNGSLHRLNFCKLFWSTVLAPIGVVLGLMRALIRKIPDQPNPDYVPRKQNEHDFLERVGSRVDKFVEFCQNHTKFFRGLGIAFVVFYLLVMLTFLVLAFINHFWQAMLGLGCFVAAAILVTGVALLVSRTNTFKFLHTGYKSVKTRTCPVIQVESEEDVRTHRQHAL